MSSAHWRRRLLLLIGLLLLVPGCARRAQSHTVITVRSQLEAGDDANKAKWTAKNCPFGMPAARAGADLGPTEIVYREGYVLQHSSRDRLPVWVCEGINNEQINGPGDRDRSNWSEDPDLVGPKAFDDDYKGSGYDRGHMAPAMNAKRTQALMDQTHFFSNAVPQEGKKFNQTVWNYLEQRVQGWLEPTDQPEDTELYIITGPMFWEEAEDNPTTADGLVDTWVIGDNEVSVPTHVYKIVVEAVPGRPTRAVAFVMENKTYPGQVDYGKYIKPVSWIEERTGINFMPDLDEQDPELRNRLEQQAGEMFE